MSDAVTRAEHERDRLKRRNERFEDQLDAARRAGFRQAALRHTHRQLDPAPILVTLLRAPTPIVPLSLQAPPQ